ncbi:MAG TPA: hypothetical protein EYP56_18560 [Planctomycetaceae bacterium]|nr:hypothetical protein [Planctomycetaceae bacterium]
MQTLAINLHKAKGRIPSAPREAYSTVVAVNEKNQVHAFKIKVSADEHFVTIKEDTRSRIQDTAITAEALLPGGPYNLWLVAAGRDLSGRQRPFGAVCAASAPAEDAQGRGDRRHAC